MPLSGPDEMESKETLDWAMGKINSKGGIGGQTVELVYRDTYKQDIVKLAQEFIENPEINIVIGPQRSSDVFLIAPLFIKSKKLLISPTATAGEITRAFSKQDYFWRTVQPDVTQLRCIIDELASREVKKLSLIYVDNSYGHTFYQWTGFFTTELGIELTSMVSYDQHSNLETVMEKALSGNPEYIIAAAYADEAVKLKKIIDQKDTPAKLFFTDAVETPFILSSLGEQANGIELMSPAADPASGFEEEFSKDFGYIPFDYAATHYDAFMLAVCTLARQKSLESINPFRNNEDLAKSFKNITTGRGKVLNWYQLGEAVNLILQKEIPNINGAASSLEFDIVNGVDPVKSFYSLNRVETRGNIFDFWTIRRFSSDETNNIGILGEKTSSVFTRASKKENIKDISDSNTFIEKKDLWAVIIATSTGWENYRHQADALAFYHLLKDKGVSDENIILMLKDDIPWLEENPLQGDVHHQIGGPNLRDSAVIDYSKNEVTLENFKDVLLGNSGPETPQVIKSNQKSNVIVYMVDHGLKGMMPFSCGDMLSSSELAFIVDKMGSDNRFRQMFLIVEACFGGSIGLDISTQGVAYFTGASESEASFGAIYDSSIKQWLADDFTVNVINTIRSYPDISINNLYLKVYEEVTGSHVKLLNHVNFGNTSVSIDEFISP